MPRPLAPSRRALALAAVALTALLVGMAASCGGDGPVSDDGRGGAGTAAGTAPPGTDGTVGTAPPGTDGTTPGTAPEGGDDEEALDPSSLPPDTYEIATAIGCEIEVVAKKGTGPSGPPRCGTTPTTEPQRTVEPPANGSGRRSDLPDIPRFGFASAGSRRTTLGWAFSNPTYFKHPMTFLVTGRSGPWVKVLLPARPNHTEGWVRADQVRITTTTFRMELTLSDYRLVVYEGNQVLADTKVVTGTPRTPTPTGRFYLNDKEQQSWAGGSYGPWVLSTNGYSEAMDLFDGHLPVIAFHGTNLPGLIGTRSSNGCVRMTNDVVTLLAGRLPLGTPIDIRP